MSSHRRRATSTHLSPPRHHSARLKPKPLSLAVAVALVSFGSTWVAAAPTGGQVVAGSASIQRPNAQTTLIQQSTPRAVLNWQSFGIAAGEAVVFQQPSASAVALNRVVGADPSLIYGSLQANGQVFLVNPAGVLFGRGAAVDVGGLVASTLSISNQDFMAGRYAFSGGPGLGSVVNEGSIRAADGGYVALLGSQVVNSGTIVANAGSVGLGAGESLLLDFAGDGLMSLKVNAAAAAAKIEHGGVIQADGGRVIMSARAKNALTATAVNVDGIVRARGLGERNGEIFLDGGRSGITSVSGTLDASGANAGQKGGEIRVLGEYVGLFGNALLDASGAAGGGTVLVGGDFQGFNPAIPNAKRTFVDRDAVIAADATQIGNGGKVILWADERTSFLGSISARGGMQGGNGGFVEVSGKRTLNFAGAVDTSAPLGSVGTLLLDPTKIRVVPTANAETSNLTLVDQFGDPDLAGDGDTKIDVAAINNSAATVTLQATEDIDFETAVNMTNAGAGLIAQAGRSINVNPGSTITTNGGVITLSARDPGTAQIAGGTVNINAALASNGGTITVTNNGSSNPIALGADVNPGSASVTFADAVSLAAASIVTGNGGITFSSTVDGGFALTANSTNTTRFAGLVGAGTPLASLTTNAGGTTEINGGGVSTSGAQTYNDIVTLGANTTLASSGGGNITFGSFLNGAWDLTVNTAGTTAFQVVDGLTSLTTDAPGSTTLVIDIRTSGAQTYNDPVTVSGSPIGGFVSTAGGPIRFASTLDGAVNMTITTSGLATFEAAVGGTTPLNRLTVDGGGTTVISGGGVRTTGIQTYSDAVTLGADATLASTGGADITFASTVNGAQALVVSTAGTTAFRGSVGGTTPLASLTTTAGGTTAIEGGSISTTGIQTYGDAVNLGANTTLTSTGGGNITFSTLVNGAFDLFANTAGTTTFAGTVGGVAPLASLTTDAAGTTALNTGAIATSGAQTYNDPITIGANATLTSTGSGNVTFASTISAAAGTSLNVNTAGTTTFGGAISSPLAFPFFVLTTDAPGNTVINGGTFSTPLATITFNDPVTLAGNTTLNGAGSVRFGSTLDGAFALTLGHVSNTFDGVVGGVTPLASISTDIVGTTFINTTAVNTTGAQSYNVPVSLGANTTLTSTGGGNIAFASTLQSPGTARSLTVNTAGATTFGGAVGGGNPLLSITTDAAGTTAINGGAVTTTGAQSYLDPVTLGSNTTLSGTTGSFASVSGGGFDLTLDFSGTMDIDGPTFTGIRNLIAQSGGTTRLSGTLTTSGMQTYNDSLVLLGDTTLESTGAGVAGNIIFSNVDSAVSGSERSLTVNTAGTSSFGVVGATIPVASLTTDAAGASFLTAGAVRTTGVQTFNDAVYLDGNKTFTSTDAGAITFANSVNGAFAITVNTAGTTTFGGPVGNTNVLTSIATDAAGATTISAASIRTSGAQTYNDAVTLGANTTLTSTGAGAIAFGSAVDGAFALTANTGGTTRFSGAVGTGTPLAMLTTDAAGGTALDGGSVVTSGAQIYNDAITLGANTTLTSTGSGAITLAGGVTGPFSLTANTAGTLTFGGAVDGTGTPLTSLVTDAGGSTVVLGGTITTSGEQTYNDPVSLGADATLTSTAGGAITFNQSVDGAFGLTANTAGATTFSAIVGGTTPLASLTTDAAGTTVLNTTAITTTAAQTYGDPATLGSNTTLASTGGGTITFNNTLDGAFALAVNNAGVLAFNRSVGGTTPLTSLTSAAGSTRLGELVRGISTTGAQTYSSPLALGGGHEFTSIGGGDIAFSQGIDLNTTGPVPLVVNTAGATIFAGAITQNRFLNTIETDAPGTTVFNGVTMGGFNRATFNDNVVLTGNSTVTPLDTFYRGTVNGPYSLVTRGATFDRAVGNASPLASLEATGPVQLNGGGVTTTGAQLYRGGVTLGADATLTSTAGGAISIGGANIGDAMTGPFAVNLNTAGVTTLSGGIQVASLITDAAGTTVLMPDPNLNRQVATTGAQTYNDPVMLGGETRLSAGSSPIRFASTLDGAFGLTIFTSGNTTFGGTVGGTIRLSSLTARGPGGITTAGTSTIAAAAVLTTGNQAYNGPVVLAASPLLDSSAGNVTFSSSIDADAAAGNRGLTVNAPAGTVTFSGNVGAGQALADLDVTAGPTTIVFDGAPAQTVNMSAQGGNTATFNGPVVLASNLAVTTDGAADNNVTFAGAVNADNFANARTLTVTSGTGTTSFGGAVGNAQELGGLTVSAGQVALGGNVSVTGGGAVDLTNVPSIAFASGVTIDTDRAGGTSAAGDVRFGAASFTNTAAADATLAIDASADNGAAAGNVTLGTIGNANRLDQLAILGNTVSFAGPVSARQVALTANAVVTPTGQIQASQGFSGSTAGENAALLLRGLSGPGQFGTRDAPIQIDAPGLFVVIPNTPNTLPFVFLAGDPNRSPVYQFATDPMHRRVFYNGAAPDSPADRAAQGAITQQLRSLLDELAMAGFAKENIRKQLLQGIILETGLARPGIDEFVGEGVAAPPTCDPQQKNVPSGVLTC